jgi:MFS family permease
MPGFRELSRNRDFTLLWTGQTISGLGTTISLFSFPLVGYALSGSTLVAAAAEALFSLGMVATLLPAGAIADRVNQRTMMRASSALGAALFSSLAVAGVLHVLTVPHLLVVALGCGVVGGIFTPAEAAAVPRVVAPPDLPTAMSQNQAREAIASLLGGPVGGALFAIARWLPFAADAVSYAACWLLVGRLRTPLDPVSSERTRLRADIAEGLRTTWRVPLFRVLLVWAPLVNLTLNAVVFLTILRLIRAGESSVTIGLVEAGIGVSALTGSVAAPWLIERVPTGMFSVAIGWSFVPLSIPLAMWNRPVIAVLALGVGFFFIPAGNAGVGAYRVAMTPPELLGRVQSAMQFVSRLTMPLSSVLAGALITTMGGRDAMLILGALTGLVALIPTLSRAVRSVPRPAAWRPVEAAA